MAYNKLSRLFSAYFFFLLGFVKLTDTKGLLLFLATFAFFNSTAQNISDIPTYNHPFTQCDYLDLGLRPLSSPSLVLDEFIGVQEEASGTLAGSKLLRIRGRKSFFEHSPLYVVDGVYFDNIDFLSNNDIASIEVLKSGFELSQYGLRGANGVVKITTKVPTLPSKTSVSYSGYGGVKILNNLPKLASSQQYSLLQQEKGCGYELNSLLESIALFGGDSASVSPAVSTSWPEELIKKASVQSHHISLSRSFEGGFCSFSSGFYREEGFLKESNKLDKFTERFSGSFTPYRWLKIGGNIAISSSTLTAPNNPWEDAFVAPPIVPVFDNSRADSLAFPQKFASPSQVGMAANYQNPVAVMAYSKNKDSSLDIMPQLWAKLSFLDNKLTLSALYGENFNLSRSYSFSPEYIVGGLQSAQKSRVVKETNFFRNSTFESRLSYTDSFSGHNLSAQMGVGLYSERWQNITLSGFDIEADKEESFYLTQTSSEGRIIFDDGLHYNTLSLFGSLNYDYNQIYFLSTSLRGDATSKFGALWGLFPSVAAAWQVTNLPALREGSVLTLLCLSGEYGTMANDRVASKDGYLTFTSGLNSSGVFGDDIIDGYSSLNFTQSLVWERTSQFDLGLDLGLFNNSLLFGANLYRSLSKDVQFKAPNPIDEGTILCGGASIQNSGLELSLGWQTQRTTPLQLSISASVALQSNKILDLGSYSALYGGEDFFETIALENHSVGSYFGWQVDGVYKSQEQINSSEIATTYGLEVGDFKYVDQNGDNEIDDDDRVVLASSLPKAIANFKVSLLWKNFQLSLLLHGQWGGSEPMWLRGERANYPDMNYDFALVESIQNGSLSASTLSGEWNISQFNSWYMQKSDYLSIENIQLSYTLAPRVGSNLDRLPITLFFLAERPYYWFSGEFSPFISGQSGYDPYSCGSAFIFGLQITY